MCEYKIGQYLIYTPPYGTTFTASTFTKLTTAQCAIFYTEFNSNQPTNSWGINSLALYSKV